MIEREIQSPSLRKALEEFMIILWEGKKENQEEDVPKAAQMKQAWFSGADCTCECWLLCIQH